jgi:hypothetical protein
MPEPSERALAEAILVNSRQRQPITAPPPTFPPRPPFALRVGQQMDLAMLPVHEGSCLRAPHSGALVALDTLAYSKS